MNIVRKIFQNSLWLFSAQVGGRLFGVAVTMALTRYLGIQDFGRYSLIYAFCGIFGVMTDIGIDTILVREASRSPEKAGVLMGNGMIIKAAFSLLALVAAGGLAQLMGVPGESVRLILLASLSFLASPLTLYSAMYQSQLRLRYPALFNLAGRALALLFVLFALYAHGDLGCIVLALLGATFAQALLTVWVSHRFFRPVFRIDAGLCRNLVSQAWPLALNNLLLVLILRVDQIMIQRLCPNGDYQLGLYSAAVRYCELFHVLPAVYFASVFPLLSRLTDREDDKFRRLYTLSLKYLTLAITPVVLFSLCNAAWIMSLLFGETFAGAAGVMEVLIGSEVFVFLTWVVVNTAVSSGRQRVVPTLTLASLAANVGLNLWLIPRHGAQGAAGASLISYGLVLPLTGIVNGLRPVALAFLRTAIRPAAGAFLLWLLLSWLPPGWALSGAVVFAGFPVLMFLLGALGREDIHLLRQAFQRDR
jgi:O-antigen/teichoic acid export membrane protein